MGDTPLSVWNDLRMVAKVVAWRDSRAATPRAADIGVTVLRALLEFGRLRSLVTFNAAEKIPKIYRRGDRAEIIWTNADMSAFVAKAAELDMTHVTDGLRLAALTGLRREDLVTLNGRRSPTSRSPRRHTSAVRASGCSRACPVSRRWTSYWKN